jgi:hypothetical protein
MIAAEIRDRKARIEALQQRWRKLQTTFYQMLAERGAQLAHIPGGSTGLLVCEYTTSMGASVGGDQQCVPL